MLFRNFLNDQIFDVHIILITLLITTTPQYPCSILDRLRTPRASPIRNSVSASRNLQDPYPDGSTYYPGQYKHPYLHHAAHPHYAPSYHPPYPNFSRFGQPNYPYAYGRGRNYQPLRYDYSSPYEYPYPSPYHPASISRSYQPSYIPSSYQPSYQTSYHTPYTPFFAPSYPSYSISYPKPTRKRTSRRRTRPRYRPRYSYDRDRDRDRDPYSYAGGYDSYRDYDSRNNVDSIPSGRPYTGKAQYSAIDYSTDSIGSMSEQIPSRTLAPQKSESKELIRIGGLKNDILGMITKSLIADKTQESTDQVIADKTDTGDSPYIQFGSTKISLKSNAKGGITVTVGKSVSQ